VIFVCFLISLLVADNVTKKRRSEIMSNVRSSNTEPELIVRRYLFSNGFRYKLNDKNLPGKPDIKLTKYRTLIFVHGCFWHGHNSCNIYVMPRTNKKFWYGKIETNVSRDRRHTTSLRKLGWHVYIVWECDLRPSKRASTLMRLKNRILKNRLI